MERTGKFKSHITYVLNIDNGRQFYIGSHNGNRDYTEYGILSQSGNPLQRAAVITHDWNSYYDRVKLHKVEQFETEEQALAREQELINQYMTLLPRDMVMNKTGRGNLLSSKYAYNHNAEWRDKHSAVMNKPKSLNSLRAKKSSINADVMNCYA